MAELWLVTYNDDAYYGTDYSGVACPDLMLKTFYYTDGKPVENLSDLYHNLTTQGKYERMLWQCH